MLNEDIKKAIHSADNHKSLWSKPYFIKPSIFETTKPGQNKEEEKQNDDDQSLHSDTFNITFAAEYLDELYNNRYDQYVRISLLESHGDNGKESKFSLTNLKLYGVPYLDDNNKEIELDTNGNKGNGGSNQYKYEIENKFESELSPKPGKGDARVLMREHVFFINVGNKTVEILKNTIIEEYDRLNAGSSLNNNKYNPKQLILVLDGYGFIKDMMDTTVLKKTLPQIGVKQGNNNTGYYITVGFC